jgi:lipoyl(octanoyl) transferase
MPSSDRTELSWCFLGRISYPEASELQRSIRERIRRSEAGDHLLLLEHPHVYTLGRNADPSDVLAEEGWLRARGAEVFETDRGGKVTYHGPGQLVGYPIFDLSPDRRDLRRYVRDLQEVLVRTLNGQNLVSEPRHRTEEIGVWVADRKIASIGVHVSRWITTHGFALNVSTDLSFFSAIVPCGLPGVEMASIESLTGRSPSLESISEDVARHFAAVFERRPRGISPAQLSTS